MDKKKCFDEQTLGDIILFDPVTPKGRGALEELRNMGLDAKEITPSFFFKELRAESVYNPDKENTQTSHLRRTQQPHNKLTKRPESEMLV